MKRLSKKRNEKQDAVVSDLSRSLSCKFVLLMFVIQSNS